MSKVASGHRRAARKTTVAPKSACPSMSTLPVRFALWNVPLGHNVTPPIPPDFGPVKFTEVEQRANPDKPMTRVIKDVLHLGVAKVGYDSQGKAIPWNVTPEVMALINSSVSERMGSGESINIIKGHGDENLDAYPDDIICPIDAIRMFNGVLWVASYVTPEQKIYLMNPGRKVSVGVQQNYSNGDLANGEKIYRYGLRHVGIVDNPAQLRQGAFLALANSSQGTGKMDQTLIDVLNKLLAAAGAGAIPETITDMPGLVAFLEGVASTIEGAAPAEPKEPDEGGGEGGAADDLAGAMANMGGGRVAMSNKNQEAFFLKLSNTIKAEVKPLRDEIESLKADKTNSAKEAYIEFETALGKAGVAAVTLANKRKLAPQVGWRLMMRSRLG